MTSSFNIVLLYSVSSAFKFKDGPDLFGTLVEQVGPFSFSDDVTKAVGSCMIWTRHVEEAALAPVTVVTVVTPPHGSSGLVVTVGIPDSVVTIRDDRDGSSRIVADNN